MRKFSHVGVGALVGVFDGGFEGVVVGPGVVGWKLGVLVGVLEGVPVGVRDGEIVGIGPQQVIRTYSYVAAASKGAGGSEHKESQVCRSGALT